MDNPAAGGQIPALLAAALLLPAPLAVQSGPDIAGVYRRDHEAEIVRDFAELRTYPNRASDTEDITRPPLRAHPLLGLADDAGGRGRVVTGALGGAAAVAKVGS